MKCLGCGADFTDDTIMIVSSEEDKIQVSVECGYCDTVMFAMIEEEDLILAD